MLSSDLHRGAGIGGLGITVEGPSESKMSCKDNKDGSCDVEYIPYAPGPYDVNITYGGQHIPGISGSAVASCQTFETLKPHKALCCNSRAP